MPSFNFDQSFTKRDKKNAIPIRLVTRQELDRWLAGANDRQKNWVQANNFEGASGTFIIFPDKNGQADKVLLGLGKSHDCLDSPWTFASLPKFLPTGSFRIESKLNDHQMFQAAFGWGAAQYEYSSYKNSAGEPKQKILILEESVPTKKLEALLTGITLTRDLINTPPNHMGPTALAKAASNLARQFDAKIQITSGDDLLKANLPLIHAVGRAAEDPPRLIDLQWGQKHAPKITLVGKGVCFDTGGLDLKSAAGMRLMKKDMGGAATVLGLAYAIMWMDLPIRLRVLIPAVENSVAGNAYRPGDILTARNGKTIEIGNTDAEGRLVLGDALVLADEEKPDYLIDFATLTGAARIALGPDLPAFYTNNDAFAEDLAKFAKDHSDPLWRMPLWSGYDDDLNSKVADLNNISSSAFAGSITAALFLQNFVSQAKTWAHFDIFGWNQKDRSGRPEGGEAMALRAIYAWLEDHFQRQAN